MIDCNSNHYSNKRGIYRDFYRVINAENKEETFKAFKQRKGIYRDIYKHIEAENRNKTTLNECFNSFGNGFVSSLKSMFQTPKDFIIGIGLVFFEWFLSTKKQLHIFSKLGKIAGVAQLLLSITEIYNKKNVADSCYYAGSGISSLGFSHKYTGLLNCFSLLNIEKEKLC